LLESKVSPPLAPGPLEKEFSLWGSLEKEVSLWGGGPEFTLNGLPSSSCMESYHLDTINLTFMSRNLVINIKGMH
jgi:hypothetical protein